MGNEGMALGQWHVKTTAEALGWPTPLNRLSILNTFSRHLFGYSPGLLAWGMAGLEVGWNPESPNAASHFQSWDNLVQRGRISNQVTAGVRMPSRQQHPHFNPVTCYPESIPKNSFLGWGFVGLGWVFLFPWFILHSQDVIKVQSEERRETSSVSVISSTSC